MKILLYAVMFFTSINLYSQNGRIVYSRLSDTISLSDAVYGVQDTLFRFVASQKNILDFSDCNICKSRAHIISRLAEKNFLGVFTGKAWLFAGPKLVSRAEHYRTQPEVWLNHKGICSRWGYHVAPVIILGTDTFVIDPATQQKAVKLNEWAESITPPGGEGFIVTKHSAYYIFPDNPQGLFDDRKALWQDENESLFDGNLSRSIDEMVRASLGIIEPWKMRARIKQLEELLGTGN